MKQFIHNVNFKYVVFFLLISLAIGLDSPFLKIADQYPLQDLEKRLYLITLLFFILIFKLLLFPGKKTTLPAILTPELQKKIEAQRGRFAGAMRFLKNTYITKHTKNVPLTQLPWCLVIGGNGSGKTSLLANANVNYILTKQFKQETIKASETCDWWATRDLVLVDVPGAYLSKKNSALWHNFIKLTKDCCGKQTLSTIMITLPLPELIKQQYVQQKKQMLADLKQSIAHLREQFGNELNFYFVVTKCDQLPGFLDFFSENSTEELAQAWGVTLPLPKQNESAFAIFTQRFNALIKRLNSQLIYRLHHERNSNARPGIKDFPLQLERTKEVLGNIIKTLITPEMRLQGVFLTSASQPITEQPAPAQALRSTPHQTLHLLRAAPMLSRAYFVRQLLLQGLFSTAEPITAPQKTIPHWQRRITYAISLIAIATAAILLGQDFQQSVLQTYSIQNNLAQYQMAIQQSDTQTEHLVKALPLLNALRHTTVRTSTNLSKLANILSFYSDKSQKTAGTVYQQALQTIVLPEIKTTFENYLKNNTNKNMSQIYAVLKAYLMLNDPQHCQVDYVVATLYQLFPDSIDAKIKNDLTQHIQAAFLQVTQPATLSNELVTQVREKLTNLSSTELATVILKTMANDGDTLLINQNLNNTAIFTSKQNTIPTFLTEKMFNFIMTQAIPAAATEALQGNAVLGKFDASTNEATLANLAGQLRTNYITNYVAVWENLLTTLQLTPPTNLAQTDEIVESLMGDTSPLLQLLNTIKSNTSFDLVMKASVKLRALNELLANARTDQENTLYKVFVNLRQLHFYLQNMLATNNNGQAAFEAAKNHMQTPSDDPITHVRQLAAQNPEPMKTWLNNLAAQSWYFVLQEASRHIENEWQLNILTIYRSQIADPNQDVDLQQFATFVSKQGTLATFYARYLKPFVDDQDKTWQWRVVDNQKLPFSNSALLQIQQASKLQNLSRYVLFTETRNNPAIEHFPLPEKLAMAQVSTE